MILRRFIKHVTDQNWFAVGLDVIVVIVGIFLGLQVQQWNENQQLKAQEQVYLKKLHDEVVLLIELSTIRYGEKTVHVKDIQESIDVLSGLTESTKLGRQHCLAILMSTRYQNSVGKLSSISEVESNNSLSIIQNEQIADMISEYIRLHERWDNLAENSRQGSVILPVAFPDIFHLENKTDLRSRLYNEDSYTCNFDKMYESDAFKNALHSNGRKFAVIEVFYGFHHDGLVALHSTLDAELGLTHEGENL